MLMLCMMLFGVYLLMLLQVLGSLEWLLADIAYVGFKRCVYYSTDTDRVSTAVVRSTSRKIQRQWRQSDEYMRTSKVARDMVALGTRCTAVLPLAGQTKIVGAFAANVVVAEVVVEGLGVDEGLGTIEPLAKVDYRGLDAAGAAGRGRGGVVRVRGRHSVEAAFKLIEGKQFPSKHFLVLNATSAKQIM